MSATDTTTAALLLVPTPLDWGMSPAQDLTHVLPLHSLQRAAALDYWVAENAKSLRAFLKRIEALIPLGRPLQAIQINELPKAVQKYGDHNGDFDARPWLAPALAGHDIGLASEAGMPAVADPGASVVRAAHDLGLPVLPLVGPVSLLLALAASGLNGQNFAFVGYLPQEPAQRLQRLRQLEQLAQQTGQTQIWIETPYRNTAMMAAVLQGLQPGTRLCVASGLTLEQQVIRSQTVARWRQAPPNSGPDRDTAAVYALGL